MRQLLLLLFILTTASLSFSSAARAGDPNDYYACTRHIPAAERAYAIPRGILHSVALTESGYLGWPWPWTLNIDGKGLRVPTKARALALMQTRDGSLHREMAVGCMQIFVRFHGGNFESAAQMIDPRTNVWYAARYLRELFDQHGSWTEAVAHYYSSQKVYQIQYLCSVVSKRIQLGYQERTNWYVRQCGGRKEREERADTASSAQPRKSERDATAAPTTAPRSNHITSLNGTLSPDLTASNAP